MKKELGMNANKELGIRKGAVVGKAFLYSEKEGGFIANWTLDLEADRKIKGNYNDRRNPICGKCFTRKTRNGVCYCD